MITKTSHLVQSLLKAFGRRSISFTSPTASMAEKQVHYNDWPNSQGFDVSYEERSPVELKVEGSIPAYAAGTLFRTSLGPRQVETYNGKKAFRVNHWFDNFAAIHRFQIHQPVSDSESPRVTYNSRLVCDGLLEKAKKTGDRQDITFGAKYDPCMSYFQKLQSLWNPTWKRKPDEVSVAVTMSVNFPGISKTGEAMEGSHDRSKVSTLCNKTDAPVFQMLDEETLEPIGIANQTALHPFLKGAGSAAHAKSDPITGDVFNYNLEHGRHGTYRIFTVSAATGKTSILATFRYTPAYLHSLFLTEHYVILCVRNSFYKAGGAAILWKQNIVDALNFDSTKPATWFVVDKRPEEQGGRGLVATYESDPFYAFHTVNAYEEKTSTGTDVVADITAYENMDCLKRFYLDNLISDSPSAKAYGDPSNISVRPALRRFRLPLIPTTPSKQPLKASSEWIASKSMTPELATLNPKMVTHQHRYVYGVLDTGKSTFMDGLVKYDVETHNTKVWSVHGQTAGEPIFVADPDSADEDSGVLLTVVLDGIEGRSYLLVLNAQTMEELGRANVDGVIGFGFHGTHVKKGRLGNQGEDQVKALDY